MASTDEPATATPAADETPTPRPVDLRLASIHLRTGSFALARAELETMAGHGSLDDDGLLDLAEVRWRTGDLPGAGEAAAAFLASGRDSILALVIAAEATAALGRPGEARRLAGRALEAADGSLEPLFAGQPRNAIWPHDPGDPAETSTLFEGDAAGRGAGSAEASPSSRPSAGATLGVEADGSQAGEALPASLWEGHPHVAHGSEAIGAQSLPDGRSELDAAREALDAGDASEAAIHLALVLRISPALAPAVLEAAGSTSGAAFDLLRGDAYRLVGHEAEAQRSYAAAASPRQRRDQVPRGVPPPDEAAGPDAADAEQDGEPVEVAQRGKADRT